MSADPVGPALLRYPPSRGFVRDHPHLRYADRLVWEEPQLLATDVVWQPQEVPGQIAGSGQTPSDLGALFDKQALGGKLTVCVYCQGDRPAHHRQCLDSILKTVPQARLDLRVGAVDVGPETIKYLAGLPLTKEYLLNGVPKYALMRQMFRDPDFPLTTRFLSWFDDDARVIHTNWLNLLANDVLKQPTDVALFGLKLYYPFKLHHGGDPRLWFKKFPWHRGKPFRTRQGAPAPNGDTIHFCEGRFFVLLVEAIEACDLPCEGLTQKGGEIVLGEQLYQGGYKLKQFNTGKTLVTWDTRQALREPGLLYPWEGR